MTSTALTITAIDNEPRVLDTDLAQQLGLSPPTDIRKDLIAPNREELESFGSLRAAPVNPGPKGGRPTTAYYLNKDQALLICILSRTEKAKQVRAEVIRRFHAYEELVEAVRPRLPGNYLEALKALTAEVESCVREVIVPGVRHLVAPRGDQCVFVVVAHRPPTPTTNPLTLPFRDSSAATRGSGAAALPGSAGESLRTPEGRREAMPMWKHSRRIVTTRSRVCPTCG